MKNIMSALCQIKHTLQLIWLWWMFSSDGWIGGWMMRIVLPRGKDINEIYLIQELLLSHSPAHTLGGWMQ